MAGIGRKFPQTIKRTNFFLKYSSPHCLSACNRYFSEKGDEDDKKLDLKLGHEVSADGKDTKVYTTSEKLENKRFEAKTSEESKEAAKKTLVSLLSEVKISSNVPTQRQSDINLAKPLKRPTKRERFSALKTDQSSPQKEIENAVKVVASTLKGNTEEIESELNKKLNSLNMSKENFIENVEKDIDADSVLNDEVNKNVMSSVEEVASTIIEKPMQPKSELTKRLLRLSLDGEASLDRKKYVAKLLGDMKIQPSNKISEKTAATPKKVVKQMPPRPQYQQQIKLFDSPPLHIFSLDSETKKDTSSILWQKLQEKELELLVQYAPTSAFEEMILWTEQGKHWKFPIDNEIDMGAEENVGFNEHVFLEQHLHGFPTKGPIRHFMELVVVGLSKNPYITVDRKIENINWFRDYFKEKEEILKESGAIG